MYTEYKKILTEILFKQIFFCVDKMCHMRFSLSILNQHHFVNVTFIAIIIVNINDFGERKTLLNLMFSSIFFSMLLIIQG